MLQTLTVAVICSEKEITCMQVECPAVTPEVVLQASGHVERFTDLMVTDLLTGDCHRADHLLEHALEALLEDPKKSLSPEDKKAGLKAGLVSMLKPIPHISFATLVA